MSFNTVSYKSKIIIFVTTNTSASNPSLSKNLPHLSFRGGPKGRRGNLQHQCIAFFRYRLTSYIQIFHVNWIFAHRTSLLEIATPVCGLARNDNYVRRQGHAPALHIHFTKPGRSAGLPGLQLHYTFAFFFLKMKLRKRITFITISRRKIKTRVSSVF